MIMAQDNKFHNGFIKGVSEH